MNTLFFPRTNPARAGFTLVELLTVMAVIAILAGMVLSVSGYVQRKGAMSRAEAEMAAMAAALESYKADNGNYPRDNNTDALDPASSVNPANYKNASRFLYGELSGDKDYNRQRDSGAKVYFEFKPSMLDPTSTTATTVNAILDPFGYSYGYSTAYQKWQESGASGTQKGFNPTYDLWSTAGKTVATGTNAWLKNW